jgi:ABC-type oligopeptide transport system ATPase subunit
LRKGPRGWALTGSSRRNPAHRGEEAPSETAGRAGKGLSATQGEAVVEARDIVVDFQRRGHSKLRAVDGASFGVARGEIFGIAGESGSGKTTTMRAIAGLVDLTSGNVIVDDQDIHRIGRREMRKLRHKMQMIYQDPQSSLDAMMSAGDLIEEGLIVHRMCASRVERAARVRVLGEMVSLREEQLLAHPFELSGGQLQRVAIARALSIEPSILICDEIVSALDVSVQAQILELLKDLQRRLKLTVIFVSHDLGVLSYLCDRIAVMSEGKVVEIGTPKELVEASRSAYTKELIEASPEPDPVLERERRSKRLDRP